MAKPSSNQIQNKSQVSGITLTEALNNLIAGGVPLFTATTNGTVPASGGSNTVFLRGDGLWSSIPGVRPIDDDYGDVVVSGSGTVMDVKDGVINDATRNFIVGGTNIDVVYDSLNDELVINATGSASGEANTASNVGAGEGVFKQKTGVNLEFKTLVAGTNVTLTPGTDTVTINSTASATGDVVGPASSVNNDIALFDGTTGKLIKDSGVTLASKQDTLVSGTSIKTVNSNSLLGAGDVAVQPTLVSGTNIKTVNGNSLLGSGDIAIAGTGDVVGPASSVTNRLVSFDGTTGKLIKDSGKLSPTGDIVGTVDSQTLTNKTLTSPVINSATASVVSLNGGQLAGMRNKIINGKMEITQRGTSFVSPLNYTYTLDRFLWNFVGSGAVTISQQTDAPASSEFRNSLRVAVTSNDAAIASSDVYAVGHTVEGFNVSDLIGRTFMLSFWVRSTKTGTHCVALGNSAADRAYVSEYTVNAADTWEKKTITINGGLISAGGWNFTNGLGILLRFTLAAGASFQTTADAWQTGNFLATSSQVNCLDTIGNIFAITGVQLEVGSVATPFEHRTYGMELALCQRYYYRITQTDTSDLFGPVYSVSTTTAILTVPINMRTAPSSLDTTGVAADYSVTFGGTTTLCSAAPVLSAASTNYLGFVGFTVASGLTAAQAGSCKGQSGTQHIGFSAEL